MKVRAWLGLVNANLLILKWRTLASSITWLGLSSVGLFYFGNHFCRAGSKVHYPKLSLDDCWSDFSVREICPQAMLGELSSNILWRYYSHHKILDNPSPSIACRQICLTEPAFTVCDDVFALMFKVFYQVTYNHPEDALVPTFAVFSPFCHPLCFD